MIPKIIHFVWVGDNSKTDLIKSCMRSWQQFLPDYKIIEWGNNEVKAISNHYVQEAYANRKWAFVSDFVRLKALCEYGGFYFDTDLEITQNLDLFHNFEFVSGFENFKGNTSPITALMGAEKGSQLVSDLLKQYDSERFVNADGSFNDKTNTLRISEYFKDTYKLPSYLDPSRMLSITSRIVIFPSFYFCTPEANKVNYAIHHFDGSWHTGFLRNCILKFGRIKILLCRKIRSKSSLALPIYASETLIYQSPVLFDHCLVAIRMKPIDLK